MAQLTIPAAEFTLNSTWTCHVVYTYNSTGAFSSHKVTRLNFKSDEKIVSFSHDDLIGATVKSVTVHASYGTGLLGGTFKIDGVVPDNDGMVRLSNPDFTDGTISILFSWTADTDDSTAHNDYPTYNGSSTQTVDKEHQSISKVERVYVIVDYEVIHGESELIEYTDPELVRGETYVKAVHMTELQTNVNIIRTDRGLDEYSFTSIAPMETSLARWNDHVLEIRSAIDEMNVVHEGWIALTENYPRFGVLVQLRRVVRIVSKPDSADTINYNTLVDIATGSIYELAVTDGQLTMSKAESANPPPSNVLIDTATSTTYEFKAIDGDLMMSEIKSGILSEFGTFTDTATSVAYKLEVVNGDLTMSEV